MFLAPKKYCLSTKSETKIKASCIVCLLAWLGSSDVGANSSIAFFYGKPVPVELLAKFERVVIEPDNIEDIGQLRSHGVEVFAYLSVGEINSSRSWFAEIPESWLLGKNTAWGSHIVDLNQKAWHEYLIDKLMAPLWDRGYSGFFIDTLDSYQLVTKDIKHRYAQQQALINLIRAMRRRFPGIKLILNRGFDLLPDIADDVVAVAAESLYRGWNPASNSYNEITKSDSGWLLKKLNQVRDQFGLQIIVIDYVSPKERNLAREVANKISELGFIPWVSNPSMDMIGVGEPEVFPKRILVIYDGKGQVGGFLVSNVYILLAKFMEYFGYTFEYVDARKGLPNYCLVGQYTGIVTQLNSDVWLQAKEYKAWLMRHNDDGMNVVALGKY